MNLNQQITSLEISKRLKELGVKQESLFWWSYYPHLDKLWLEHVDGMRMSNMNISAFTVAELGEMLKKGTYVHTFFHSLEVQVHEDDRVSVFSADTEADARGKMLIYLLENKFITL